MTAKKTAEEFEAEQRAIPDDRLAEMAQNALSRLCETGGRSITMTVPPRVDDTDMVIAEVIKRFKAYAAQQKPPSSATAEEIIESILESLGDPINIHNHAFEIRPYTVDHKTEWWIFHKEVASGEPLAQWLSKFATLHAQKIADKMVEERLREELIKYDRWMSGNYWGVKQIPTPEQSVDEYLKSRER
jgi:hypothetical protein